jgi:catechol 2,3-dioxygenase-like lactoylglutathione lyase family enzyme
MRETLGDPEFTVNDDALVVAQAFRLVAPSGWSCRSKRPALAAMSIYVLDPDSHLIEISTWSVMARRMPA